MHLCILCMHINNMDNIPNNLDFTAMSVLLSPLCQHLLKYLILETSCSTYMCIYVLCTWMSIIWTISQVFFQPYLLSVFTFISITPEIFLLLTSRFAHTCVSIYCALNSKVTSPRLKYSSFGSNIYFSLQCLPNQLRSNGPIFEWKLCSHSWAFQVIILLEIPVTLPTNNTKTHWCFVTIILLPECITFQ